MSARVEVRDESAALTRKFRVRRWMAGVVVAAVALVGTSVVTAMASDTSPVMQDPVTPVTATLTTTVTPVTAVSDDDPGFNPCTEGVDGTYPASDPRHWIPGPCNAGTALPFGGRFGAYVVPAQGWSCPAGYVAYTVTVYVGAYGVALAPVSRVACGVVGDPFGGGVAEVLPEMYRASARIYWP